jgi:predicted nucleotidyltransferase
MRAVATPSELDEAIADFVQRLQRGIRVHAVVLYGSYVCGTADEWSDIDLAVVSPDFEGMSTWQRQEAIARLTVHRFPRIAPIGYASSEYHNAGPHSFLREIIRTGKVVYQAWG